MLIKIFPWCRDSRLSVFQRMVSSDRFINFPLIKTENSDRSKIIRLLPPSDLANEKWMIFRFCPEYFTYLSFSSTRHCSRRLYDWVVDCAEASGITHRNVTNRKRPLIRDHKNIRLDRLKEIRTTLIPSVIFFPHGRPLYSYPFLQASLLLLRLPFFNEPE